MPEAALDSTSIRGLLRMAGDEGLLRDREDYGDKLLFSLRRRPLPEWHKQQILEQVVLNSKIHSVGRLPLDWVEGDFLDLGLIHLAAQDSRGDYECDQFSPEILEGMLRARGYDRSFEEWLQVFREAEAVLNEVEDFKQTHPNEAFESTRILIQAMVDRDLRKSEKYDLAQKWNKANLEVGPLMSVFEEYLSLSEYASKVTRCMRTPVYRLSPNLVSLSPNPHIDGEAIQIYRLATENLGVIPIMSSLTEAIELSKHPDTVAFRAQIDQWLESLQDTSVDRTSQIQKDIRKATESLTKARDRKRCGFLTGIISIPVSLAGLLNPFIGALGLSLTCIGVLLDRSAQKQVDSVRWVSFGSNLRTGQQGLQLMCDPQRVTRRLGESFDGEQERVNDD